jgi:hypothetical protein
MLGRSGRERERDTEMKNYFCLKKKTTGSCPICPGSLLKGKP